MTGFGSAESGPFRVEARSLNHRFLEITFRMPPVFIRHEIALRDMVKERFERGKFDISVSITGEGVMRLRPNTALARELISAFNTLKEELSLSGEIGIEATFDWKELLITEEAGYDEAELFGAVGKALEELESMRLKEGEAVGAILLEGAGKLKALNERLRAAYPQALESAREKFRERLALFLPEGADESKLIMEAGKAAEKADITEELARIESHLDYMKKTVSEGGKIGRKLDFILQELNREINTIASKSEQAEITRTAVEMKEETESLREQAQNIQ